MICLDIQGEFTLWDGFEFNFLTIWQVRMMNLSSLFLASSSL